MKYYKVYYSDELYHFGILGQKWGIRRFENEDGTLTPAGKERYSKESRKKNISADESRKRELLKKKPEELSNKELQELNNRLNLERNYQQNINAGKSAVKTISNKIFEKTTEKIAVAIVAAGSAWLGSYFKK